MKRYFYIFLFLFSFQYLVSKEIQISNPIVTDYYSCVHSGDLIIVYGNFGVINVSKDNGKTWKTQKIFEKGRIIDILFENNGIIVFNENGEIAKSDNNARFFLQHSKLVFEERRVLLQCIKFNDDFIVRSHDFILVLNNNLEIKKRIDLPELNFYNYSVYNRNSIVNFQDNLLVSIDNGKIYKYDKYLNIIETIDLSVDGFIPSWYDLNLISDKLVIGNNGKIITYNFTNNEKDTLLEFYNNINGFNPLLQQILDNKFLFIQNQDELNYKLYFVNEFKNIDSSIIIENQSYVNFKYEDSKEKITFVTKKDNKFILVGEKNTIIIVETSKDKEGSILTKTKEISKGYGLKTALLDEPYRLDSTIILNLKNGYDKSHFLFEIKDNEELIKSKIPIYKLENGILNTRYFDTKKVAKIKHYDYEKNEYINVAVYGEGFSNGCRLFKTNDFFRSNFNFTEFEDRLIDYSVTDMIIDNFINYDTNYIFTSYNTFNNKHFSQINIYNSNFDTTKIIKLYNNEMTKKVIFNYVSEINHFTTILQDMDNFDLIFLNTNDAFLNSDTITKIKKNYFEKFKKVKFQNDDYLIYLLYDTDKSFYSLELLNLKNNIIIKLYEIENNDLYSDIINFDVYQDKIYISIGNKLLHFKGTLENPEWDEYSLPKNGMIDNYMYIQNNFLYCKYSDDKNDLNLYRIEIVDSLVNSVEIDVENEVNNSEYVYLYEPYPNPSNSVINTEVFWSNSFDIVNADFGVYNLNGEKISNSTNLTLERLNNNKGNIKWNCTGVPSGTYLIKIQHGNNTKSVKVVVN